MLNPEVQRYGPAFQRQGHLKALKVIIMILSGCSAIGCFTAWGLLIWQTEMTDPYWKAYLKWDTVILFIVYVVDGIFSGFGFIGALNENWHLLLIHAGFFAAGKISIILCNVFAIMDEPSIYSMSGGGAVYLLLILYMVYLIRQKNKSTQVVN